VTRAGAIGRLSPLEVALGAPLGMAHIPALPPLPSVRGATRGGLARAALEAVLLRALLRPPCLVTFSGGRDSSAVLAVAVHVARRDGLPQPVPVTLRFPEVTEAEESTWQEAVIRHLGVADWIRLELQNELDLLGELGQETLRKHGLLWPFNSHLMVPMAQQAAHGALLTGVFGDEVLSGFTYHRPLNALRGRRLPSWADVRPLGVRATPRPVRRRLHRHGQAENLSLIQPWLTPQARHEVVAYWVEEATTARLRWDRELLDRWWRSRRVQWARASLAAVGTDWDVEIESPLGAPEFLQALAAQMGPSGFADRTAAMRMLFSDLLPDDVLVRGTKASFNGAFWGPQSRRFARTWSGTNACVFPIDVACLVDQWKRGPSDARSFSLLQALWRLDNPRPSPGVRDSQLAEQI
jgi:asparagine synthetase B (glutamine-hydrolysing)